MFYVYVQEAVMFCILGLKPADQFTDHKEILPQALMF